MKITAQEIEDIAIGAAVLGTGGGGDPFIGKLLALDAVARYGSVELIQPEEGPGRRTRGTIRGNWCSYRARRENSKRRRGTGCPQDS